MRQTTAAVEDQTDILLVGVEAAGLVLHAALQVSETVGLLVWTPHLREGGRTEERFKVGQNGRKKDKMKNDETKKIKVGERIYRDSLLLNSFPFTEHLDLYQLSL